MRKFRDTNAISVTFHLMAITLFKITREENIKMRRMLKLSQLHVRSVIKKHHMKIVPRRGIINTMASNQKIRTRRENINVM